MCRVNDGNHFDTYAHTKPSKVQKTFKVLLNKEIWFLNKSANYFLKRSINFCMVKILKRRKIAEKIHIKN